MIANSVLAGVVVARWLGVESVGRLAVINVTVTTIVQVASFGLPSSNTYFIARDNQHFRAAAVNSLLFSILIGSLLGVLLSITAELRPTWFSSISPALIRVAAISIPFQLLTLIGLNIFLAVGRLREFNSLDLLGQSFVLINAVVIVFLLQRGLPELVTLNTATSVLVALLVTGFLAVAGKKLAESRWRTDLQLLVQMLSYGIRFHISILAGALIFRADLLVVNLFRGAAEAGVYSVASQVGMMLMLLPGVIATLLFPRVTAEQDARGETTCKVTRHATFVMLVCCLVAVPLSLLLPVVYGRDFADATVQLWILLPGVYLVGLQSVLVQHFNALGLPRIIPTYWIVTLIANIILVFALVPRFGARGAAIASTLSYSLIFALVTIRFLQTSGRSFGDIFFLRTDELRQLFQLGGGAGLLTRGVSK
jgi:O-antigen/teichoic acid export membrane protein